MNSTPRAIRPHIVLMGDRNSGKSSLLNSISEKDAAIVSPTPGTTTDPVSINMEFLPYGPVTFVDTPGLDDRGDLGNMRVKRAQQKIAAADIAVAVFRPSRFSEEKLAEIARIPGLDKTPLVFFSFADSPEERELAEKLMESHPDLRGRTALISNADCSGIPDARELILQRLNSLKSSRKSLLEDLVRSFQLIMMIVPIDMEAPKGRLILPQVQAIREVLDSDAATLVVKEREVDWALGQLKDKPDLAITDSQVVLKAAASVPRDIPLTTFSILFSRLKGDLEQFVRAVKIIDELEHGDRILIAESCTHKSMCDDIGRVKIPRWLRQHTGKELDISLSGGDFPSDVRDYRLIIHCGGCMITRGTMLARMGEAESSEVPITNYGIAISHLQGVLDRVLEPFGLSAKEPATEPRAGSIFS